MVSPEYGIEKISRFVGCTLNYMDRNFRILQSKPSSISEIKISGLSFSEGIARKYGVCIRSGKTPSLIFLRPIGTGGIGILATINITRVINKYLLKYLHPYLNATTHPEQTSGGRESGFENTALFTKNISRLHLITRTRFFETNRINDSGTFADTVLGKQIRYPHTLKRRPETALPHHESPGSFPDGVLQRQAGHFGEPETTVSGTFADTVLGKQRYPHTYLNATTHPEQTSGGRESGFENTALFTKNISRLHLITRTRFFETNRINDSGTFADTVLGKQIRYPHTLKRRPETALPHHESPGSFPDGVLQRQAGHVPPTTTFPERHINLTKDTATKAPDLVLRKSTMVNAKDNSEHTKELNIEKNISSELSEKISEKDISEKTSGGIDVIANEVYRIIEKRIIIEKERRGFG